MTPRLHPPHHAGTKTAAPARLAVRRPAIKTRILIRAFVAGATATASLSVSIPGAPPASAHRSGCHAAHSCPSDHGTYVCGDKGIYTYCPSTEAVPEVSDVELDYEAPDTPTVASSTAKAGGLIALALSAEKGSTIAVQEDGLTIAEKKATGTKQTITFRAPTGEHSYIVTATDAAGNTSFETDAIAVTADATKPAASLTPHAPTPLEGAARIDVNTEAGAAYTLAVTGQKTITGTGSGTTDTHVLWLRNGTYHAVVTSTDAAGNVTRVARDLRVANPSAALTVTQTSAPFHTPVEYRVDGTPHSHGTLALPGQSPRPFELGDTGTTTLTLPLPDGTYETGTAALTDFGGRTARAELPATVVDTTAPALTFSSDAARANDGTLLLALTAEKAAKVTIRAVRRGDDSSAPTAPIIATLVGNGSTQPWSHSLEPGTYELTAAAVDDAGNETRQSRTITITKPATAGEIAAGLGLLVVLLGTVVGFVLLLWRKRHWIAAAGERRRAAAAVRAHRAAVAAAQAKYAASCAAHDQAMAAFHDADRQWQTREAELSQLITWAAAPLLPHAGDTHGLRLRPNERLHETLPATMLEDRTKQGRPNRVTVAAGHAVVTSERVAFRGPKNRDWVYAQLEDVAVERNGTVLMTVSSRKTRSGIRLSGADAATERGRLLILRAIHASQGDDDTVHRDLQDEHHRHLASRPIPPRPPALPAILQPPTDAVPAAAEHAQQPAPS